jgi:signal peptidase I
MQPTLNAAEYPQRVPFFLDHVLINRLATRRYDFQRGDVVTLWSPESQGTVLIKRIVGVAGDWVSVPVRTNTLATSLSWLAAPAVMPSCLLR